MVPLGLCTGCSFCLARLSLLGSLECRLTIQDFKHHFFVISLPSPSSLAPLPSGPSPRPPVSPLPSVPCVILRPQMTLSPHLLLTALQCLRPRHPQAESQPLRLIILECIHPLPSFRTGINQLFHGSPCWRLRDESAVSPCPKGSKGNRYTEIEYTTFPLASPSPCLAPKRPRDRTKLPLSQGGGAQRDKQAGGQLEGRRGAEAPEMRWVRWLQGMGWT